MEVILFTHTHWDREWYKPFQDYRIRLCEIMDSLIDELVSNRMENFYLDGQTIVLEDYLELYPEKTALIKNLIRDKKLFIGPWYVLADEFLVSGESLIRNLLTGIKQAKGYGCNDFFGYLPDSFGHNSEMPRILSAFGIERTLLWRGAGNKKSEFIWKSHDGSIVLATYLVEGYFQDILHSKLPVDSKAEKVRGLLNQIKSRTVADKLLLPIGGDHLGTIPDMKQLISEINKMLSGYKIKQAGIDEYFNSLNIPRSELETVNAELRDNSRNPVLPGTFSSRMYLKQMNAVSTWKLSRIAEPLQVFMQTAGLVKPKTNELDYAWRLLLKNHPHDSICGCSVDEVHEENVSRFRQVDQISNALIDRCMNQLSGMIPQNKIIVCNLSNYDYSGIISVKTFGKLPESVPHQFIGSAVEFPREIMLDTQKTPICEDMREFREYLVYAENIPAFSVKTILPVACPDSVEVQSDRISNSFVEISINPDGSINLKDLQNYKTFNNLHMITDRADQGDTYNYSPLAGDKPVKAEFINSEITETGLLRCKLKLLYRMQIPAYFDFENNSRSRECRETEITTEIVLTAGSKRVEYITSWENQSENHIMQVKFNFPDKITQTVSENTFGLITREFDPDYRIEDFIPTDKGDELKTNSAPMQRFVYSQGLGIITEGLPEYVVSKNSIAITILRSTGKLSAISLDTRNFPAGPALDTPGAQCIGRHSVRYALCLADEPDELFKHADEFMGSIITDTGHALPEEKTVFPENLIKINNQNLLVYAVKSPENREARGLIIRILNISPDEINSGFNSDIGFSGFVEVNSLEIPVSEKYGMDENVIFKPYELKSLLFEKF